MTTLKKILVPFAATLFLVIALPVVASGSDNDPDNDPARTPVAQAPVGPVKEEPTNLSPNPVVYQNEGGDFQVVFPGGCGRLVTRSNEPDLFGGEQWDDIIQVSHVFCDRYQKAGEGCSVTATFNLQSKDGSIAGPEQVTPRVEATLAEYGANIVSQTTIQKEFENGVVIEGVEVLARPEMGKGEVWIRGLLVEGDIYILTAWNNQGGVWKNPDYITFFNSFQPWTD
jgi:hypothetical protein